MTSKHTASVSLYRQITVWVVGTLLLLQLLAIVTTWHCSETSQPSHGSPVSAVPHLLWLPQHGLCKESTGSEDAPFDGYSGSRSKTRVQRPFAVAFCLTSIHHLCTALINVVRLRKLHTSQDIDLVALVPKTWAPIIEASMRGSNMNDMKHWAAKTASLAVQNNSPELVKANAAQQKMHVFQGVAVSDYSLVEMLARLIALGVVLRPSDVYEHQYGMFDILHYHKEATSKIMLFELTDYKQVLYMDADGLILQNLDSVFNLNMTPVALLPGNPASPQNASFDTRVMLIQPSQALHAQLQFIVEKDSRQSDVHILTQFFSGQVQSLPDSLALQTFELRTPNEDRISGTASMLLQRALYIHFSDSPHFPQHWQWADPSRLAKLLPPCGDTCDERLSWLHVYSLLTTEREALCLNQ